MLKATVTLRLTLKGPILTQSSSPWTWGIDLVAARNTDNRFYLPGTLLAGKLNQAWQELQSAVKGEHWFKPDVEKWLGERHENKFPKTKQLFFSDLVYGKKEQITPTTLLNRIQIDRERGAVAPHQLVMIENPFLSGDEYMFVGALHFFAANQTEADDIVRHVDAGLRWTGQLGAMRSVGFGIVEQVEVEYTTDSIRLIQKPEPYAKAIYDIAIRPLYPFCISGKPVADNLFESETIIPGGATLGAIATTWNQLCGRKDGRGRVDEGLDDKLRPTLKKYFSDIHISHAFPSAVSRQRPIAIPLSLVTIPVEDDLANKSNGKKSVDSGETKKTYQLHDVAQLEGPCLIDGKVPAFAIDWKGHIFSEIMAEYGWPDVAKELRTRTAIHPDSLRAAEGELFSYEQTVPKQEAWYAKLDLSRIPADTDKNAIYQELRSLLSEGIAALGKTKTPASVEWLQEPIKASQLSDTKPINGKNWVITLQTDTLLGAPVGLDESSGKQALQDMYCTAWSELSGNKLKLVRCFARQRLSGGDYRKNVFRNQSKNYYPWLLTEAGSVFVLEADQDDADTAETLILNWLNQGLPLSDVTLKFYGINSEPSKQWQDCPFIAQNGYGEIAVNLPLHRQLKPNKITPIQAL